MKNHLKRNISTLSINILPFVPEILPMNESLNSMSVWTLKAHTHFLSPFLALAPSSWPHTRPSIQRPSSSSHVGPPRCLCIHRAAWDWCVRLKEPVELAASSMLTRLYRASFDLRPLLCSGAHDESLFEEKLWWIEFLVLVKTLMYFFSKERIKNKKNFADSGLPYSRNVGTLLLLTSL